MLVELRIIPVGHTAHMSSELAKVLQLVDASGFPYQLTPTGTCIEGGWDAIMPLVRQCHERVRKSVAHVITHITIEDDSGEQHQLERNVASVEEKVGHRLARSA